MPNPGFEYYTQCPDDYGQLNRAYPWYQGNAGSCDYYNTCVTAPGMLLDVRVPQNSFGYQYPHNGEGYGGIGMISEQIYYEYAATPLSAPLVAGENYCVSFWVSSADSFCLSSNRLGVYFSADSIFSDLDYYIDASPQVLWTEFILEQDDWVLIEGSFVAEGGERYMAIGTFDTTGIELYQFCDNPFWSDVYYYIDDVIVQLATESCNSDIVSIPNVFTPNNDGVNDTWRIVSPIELEVHIFNRWGNIVFQQTSKTIEWDGEHVTEGVYYYNIKTKQTTKTGFIHLVR